MSTEMQGTPSTSTDDEDKSTRPLAERSAQEVRRAAPRRVQQQAAADVKVARLMFFGGFALLPWLWFVAWLHFRHAAKQPDAPPALALYVRRSLVGAICGGLLFGGWVLAVSLFWTSWQLPSVKIEFVLSAS